MNSNMIRNPLESCNKYFISLEIEPEISLAVGTGVAVAAQQLEETFKNKEMWSNVSIWNQLFKQKYRFEQGKALTLKLFH